jgi:AcrR family transcriptional regulator
MPRKTDKRIRLIEAAKLLIHRQGFNLTTLADIAQEADVPLGNVYYYFKTKDAIGVAVIDKLAKEYLESLSALAQFKPAERLKSFVQFSAESLDSIARYGCSIGGLCQELGKQGGSLADQAAKLMFDIMQWTEAQFKELGFGAASEDLALSLVASIQGTYLLTHTFKDPKLANRQSHSILNWLNNVLANVGAKVSASNSVSMLEPELA